MGHDLGSVANAVLISKSTPRNISQDLYWAFAHNAAFIPIVAGIL